MLLRFTKMHGLGNDFVVLDLLSQNVRISKALVKRLADRHFGIGCDQVLLVEHPRDPDVDFRYRIFNADGSEVEQCGNGSRCFAKFVADKQMTGRNPIRVETKGGILELAIQKDGQVRVNMGEPRFAPADIPFVAEQEQSVYAIDCKGREMDISIASMGNPHGVLLVENIRRTRVDKIGRALSKHERFPENANIGFMQIVDENHFKLRVFERGVGETLACGTGACAAFVTGVQRGLLSNQASAQLPGGSLELQWEGPGNPVFMTGPATTVFEGQIRI